jgi:hypothetical protein
MRRMELLGATSRMLLMQRQEAIKRMAPILALLLMLQIRLQARIKRTPRTQARPQMQLILVLEEIKLMRRPLTLRIQPVEEIKQMLPRILPQIPQLE